ncbi:hypothetical protein GH5_00898 [Leishmania sp. Ghana 2012 LV757]|uniref:hypothetical protein n=1 Tax=Leishmania sp. Ghana 2012 LV757 TaxID=2803181 RepID=UPI001B4947FA|nr:hypothetical protein GH5_00898 [Leishmania sp. Ghana 2012 LV757]
MAESPSAAAPTIFIRCATLHSRGELLNGFFFAHRAALGIQDWYEATSDPISDGAENEEADLRRAEDIAAAGDTPHVASSPRLLPHFPVEVLYVRNSRKPYFLLEWRYPTSEEEDKQKDSSDGGGDDREGAAKTHETTTDSLQSRITEEFLRQLADRTLTLGKQDLADVGAVWKGQPVHISSALPGMTVMAERRKLELRDAQLKGQRAAEKRERAEVDSATQTAKAKQRDSGVITPAFIPRCVRRRT